MKRKTNIILASIFVMLITASCGPRYHDAVISNNSSETVRYEYDGTSETLGPGESRVYSVTLAVHAPSWTIPGTVHPKSVAMKAQGYDFIFEDVTRIPLYVTNTVLNNAITISSEYIDYGLTHGTSFSIAAHPTTTGTDGIYTATPVFKITPYPGIAACEITNGEMHVIIR
jgi:hypothetical protein